MTGQDPFPLIRAAQAGDREACARLVEENQGLIRSVANRFRRDRRDGEDLYQLGCLGFLKAVQGFDPSYGVRFSTYAVPKIAGEIRRFLRDDGPVKVSRTLKEQALAIHRARSALTGRLGRDPVLSELAAETGLSPEEIAAADLSAQPVSSLQAGTGEDGGEAPLEAALSDGGGEEAILERLSLHAAVSRLPPRDRQLICLRYFRGLTQARTARILGVSQVQVSRLERKALACLREQLE